MHDYPPLVSGALKLLFRHFSQRQEVLKAFKQVQLLVSDSDVKSYKQIKDDLDGLRLLVEKSELWVFKTKSAEESKNKGKDSISKAEDEEDKEMMMGGDNNNVENNNMGGLKPPSASLPSSDKHSAIDLDVGPPLDPQQTRNYKTIQQVRPRL